MVGLYFVFVLFIYEEKIRNDIGLKSVFVIGDKLLMKGDIWKNIEFVEILEKVV